VPLNKDILVRQDIRLLNPVIGPVAPADKPNVYEFRSYRTKPRAVRQWAELMRTVRCIRPSCCRRRIRRCSRFSREAA
jgi:hypothetical protein